MSLILSGTDGLSDVDGSAATPAIRGTDANTGIFFPAADTIAFAEGGAEVARFDSSGNFGIGTASPTANRRLDAVLNANASTGIRVANNDAGSTTSTNTTYSNGTTAAEFGMLGTGYGSYGVLTAGNGYIYVGSNKALQLSADGGFIAFGTGTTGAERARITSSGTFGINDTNPNTNYKLVVKGDTSVTPMLIASGSSSDGAYIINPSGAGYCLVLNHEASAGTTKKLIGGFNGVFGTSAVESFIVYNNGNVQNTNNSYGPISDIKVKENITDATPKLAGLMQVRVVNYNLKGELGYETHKQIGVIAQELEQVFPGLVHETPDQDKDGNDLGTTTKGVKMSVFVPMLIKAMQEMKSVIDDQAARIAVLEAK